jgi:1-acyl-sn-glycerol-3-phosphate acyltransferase
LKNIFCKLFQIYTWIIIFPISWLITAIVAFLTIVFSYLINSRWASKWIAPWWGKLIIFITISRVKVKGIENIEKNQSYIIVCNHQSIYDMLAVYGYLPVEFKWVMKKELLKMPFVGASCKALGHVFIDRDNSEEAKQSLIDSKDKITDGVSAFFFPEGTRSPNGELINFKKGAFRMAQSLNLPILPVTIKDANKIMAANSLIIYPNTITMTIHQPISAETVSGSSTTELSRLSKMSIASGL